MEISQFTYFQQVGGIEVKPVASEITYGLERLAMFIQKIENVYDIDWDGIPKIDGGKTYGDIFLKQEKEFSEYNFERSDASSLFDHFNDAEDECNNLLSSQSKPLSIPAYHQCIKASHIFNLMDARGIISVSERQSYILRVRDMARSCCLAWMGKLHE